MTAPEIIQICVALSTLATVIGGVIVSILNGSKLRDAGGKIDTVVVKAAEIAAHVNSEKTAAQGREDLLRSENKLLREMLAEKTATAGLLAQSVAQASPIPDAAKPVDVHVVNPPDAPVPTTHITP